METKKKILIVDDSAFMRRVISDIINSDKRCMVIGTASNGKEGLEKALELKPDVITLDIEMPIMNGLEMLKQLQAKHPIPVLMLSTLAREGANETIQALELGAFDFIHKPDNIFQIKSDEIKRELIEKIVAGSSAGRKVLKKYKPSISKSLKTSFSQFDSGTKQTGHVTNLVSIGTSTGGPRALQYVLPYLPSNINAGIIVVQHMPPGFTKSLSERLNQLSNITIKEAEHNDVIENGKAFIAPGDKHLTVKEEGNKLVIKLLDDAPKGGHKPAVNVMMESIKDSKKNLVGVIMTGMGADGAEGMALVKRFNNMHIIAQNEETCVVYGMPKSVVDRGIADEVVALETIADSIIKQTGVL